MRRNGWDTRLAAYLREREVMPRRHGFHDCCRFACLGLAAQGLIDPMPAWAHRYRTEAGARRMLLRLGGDLDAAATRLAADAGWPEIPVAFAGRGMPVLADLVTVDDAVEPQLGLVDLSGLHAVFAGGPEGGLAWMPLASCRRAWKAA